MGRYMARVLFFSLLWVSLHPVISGCSLEEKAALLELRASLVRSKCTPPASWKVKNKCCSWEGVECSNSTSRTVTALRLPNFAVHVADDTTEFRDWHVNLSVFDAFHTLRHLDLSYNRVDGALASQDFRALRKLTYVGLSGNGFTGGIPNSLSIMSSLRVLKLDDNQLSGSFPVEVLGGLPLLRELHLQRNKLNGSLPLSLGNHSTIQHLDLSQNLIKGNISQQAFSGLSSLQYMDVSENLLGGDIPKWAFSNLTSLECLYLFDNSFHGHFPLPSLANLSRLQEIVLSRNSRLGLDTNFEHLVPTFHLRVFAMSSCNVTKNFQADVNFLSFQHGLELVDLSNNNLSGDLPSWFFVNYTKLMFASLGNNSLTGKILLPAQPISSTQRLDLSMNRIGGSLPPNFGFIFPKLFRLNLSVNHLVGNIPSSFINMSKIETIDLSYNYFSGQIPPRLGSGCPDFVYLKLSNNDLQGGIPSTLPSLYRI